MHAGKEHRMLRSPPFNSQFEFLLDSQGNPFIRYTEDLGCKMNKGGLKHRKVDAKVVHIYPIDKKDRCPVSIITKYLSLLPKNWVSNAFYLQPIKKFKPNLWYLDKPCGVNKLRDVIKDICSLAGLPGFYSNHSLCSTSATCLYKGNVDEQIIQEITGHRSLAVRSYKRTCEAQHKKASNIIFSSQKY